MLPRSTRKGSDKSPMNPPGFVPVFGQGLRARETQAGSIGTKQWVKSIKLHKYWPLISHWTYYQMLCLTENNLESNIIMVRGTMGFTQGAQGRLLNCVNDLRERKPKLRKILEDIGAGKRSVDEELEFIMKMISTPMPTSEGDSLPTLIVHTFQEIQEHVRTQAISLQDRVIMTRIHAAIKANPILNKAKMHLRDLHVLWEEEFQAMLKERAACSKNITSHRPERTRNISMDSGFEEIASNVCIQPKEQSQSWPIGINTHTLKLPKENGYQLQLQSPFYPRCDQKPEEINFDCAECMIAAMKSLKSK